MRNSFFSQEWVDPGMVAQEEDGRVEWGCVAGPHQKYDLTQAAGDGDGEGRTVLGSNYYYYYYLRFY